MKNCFLDGTNLRLQIKSLVLAYITAAPECACNADGLKQAEIFRACGLDWGDMPNATSSQQHFWLVALLRELESEEIIVRDPDNKKWRLK